MRLQIAGEPDPPGCAGVRDDGGRGASCGSPHGRRMARPPFSRRLRRPASGGNRGSRLELSVGRASGRQLSVRRLRCEAVRVEHEVRVRYRMAELLAGDSRCGDRNAGRRGSDRIRGDQVRPVRRPPRPCLSRRPKADRAPLLHERGGAPVPTRRVTARVKDCAAREQFLSVVAFIRV